MKDTVLPVLWFEEGLDELGGPLVEAISKAVVQPPLYKSYLLCVLVGLVTSTLVIAVVAVTRLCLNLRNERRQANTNRLATVRETAKHLLHAQTHGAFLHAHRHSFCRDDAHAHQPMLPPSSTTTSGATTAASSASHSRNTSAGSASTFVGPSDQAEQLRLILESAGGEARKSRSQSSGLRIPR